MNNKKYSHTTQIFVFGKCLCRNSRYVVFVKSPEIMGKKVIELFHQSLRSVVACIWECARHKKYYVKNTNNVLWYLNALKIKQLVITNELIFWMLNLLYIFSAVYFIFMVLGFILMIYFSLVLSREILERFLQLQFIWFFFVCTHNFFFDIYDAIPDMIERLFKNNPDAFS